MIAGFAVLAATLVFFVVPASAQQRIALIIGNSAYAKGPIKNSLADGGLIAEALTSIGFEIVEGADANQTDMRGLVRDFLAKVQAAGPDAIAFVYYSGYGLEFEGDNYLIPVDARLERDSDIPIDAVRLFDILRPLADTQAVAKIVVLDATRPLPFRIEGGRLARGLGAIESAPGMIVGFSSAPGTSAPDGEGAYGAYATAIAEMVREPGLDLDTLFARIRVRTAEATNGAQVPWNVSQGIDPQFVLVPGQPSAPQRLSRTEPRQMRDIGPDRAYAMTIEEDTLESYTDFVRNYPRSPYTQRVWAIIRERREALAWRRALLINTPEAYWTYLSRYPEGMYAYDAERRLRRLSAGLRPPSGFRALRFDDVPEALDGEPTRLYDRYPDAPPPPRLLAAPPAFILGLTPGRRSGNRGLLRRNDNPFPVLINPRANVGPGRDVGPGSGPGSGKQKGQKKGPNVVNQPPNLPGNVPGYQGPSQGFPGPQGTKEQKQGTKEREHKKKGPTVVTPAPSGSPPPGSPPSQGFPSQYQRKTVTSPSGSPPSGPSQFQKKGPAVISNPNPNPPPSGGPPPVGFRGAGSPPGGAKAIVNNPAPPKPPTPPVVNNPRAPAAATQGHGPKKCVLPNGQPCKS